MPGFLAPQVLLIDDNPTQLHAREALLREGGFSVVCGPPPRTPSPSSTTPRTPPPVDVIVTDHVLPGLSGSTFVRRVRELDPRVPIIVISGMLEAEPEYAALNVTFLRKPCPPEALLHHVRTFAHGMGDR